MRILNLDWVGRPVLDCPYALLAVGARDEGWTHFARTRAGRAMTNPVGLDDAPDERRHLTVMFSDLVGSTELAAAMDPEDLHEVIETYQRAVAAVVESHGGVVAQFQGDGVVAYFGYPVAIESAGRDAVSAGLAVVEAVRGLPDRLPPELQVPDLQARVGVHTGEVVMAAVRAGGASRIADVFGEVPNLAARLQGAAAPGQVIVSDVTQRLVSGYFVMEPMGALTLKGIGREIPASLVLRHSSARRRLETGKLTGYVARRRESDWLHGHWESVQEGPARAVMVMGEPGIGKSRLLQEFTGGLSGRGSPVTTIYCGLRDALESAPTVRSADGRGAGGARSGGQLGHGAGIRSSVAAVDRRRPLGRPEHH